MYEHVDSLPLYHFTRDVDNQVLIEWTMYSCFPLILTIESISFKYLYSFRFAPKGNTDSTTKS